MAGTSDIAVIEVRGRNNDHLTRDASCTPLGLQSRRDNLRMSHRLCLRSTWHRSSRGHTDIQRVAVVGGWVGRSHMDLIANSPLQIKTRSVSFCSF